MVSCILCGVLLVGLEGQHEDIKGNIGRRHVILGALAMGSGSCWGASECDSHPRLSWELRLILHKDLVLYGSLLSINWSANSSKTNKQTFYYLVDNSKDPGMNAAADQRSVWARRWVQSRSSLYKFSFVMLETALKQLDIWNTPAAQKNTHSWGADNSAGWPARR